MNLNNKIEIEGVLAIRYWTLGATLNVVRLEQWPAQIVPGAEEYGRVRITIEPLGGDDEQS